MGDTWVDDEVDEKEVEPDTEGTEDDRCDEIGLDENESIEDDVRADEDDTYIANYSLLKIPPKMQRSRRIVKIETMAYSSIRLLVD